MPFTSQETRRAFGGFDDPHAMFDALPGMVVVCEPSPGWPLIWTSRGCLAVTGYTREEMLRSDGQVINHITCVNDRDKVLAAIDRSVETSEPYLIEYRIRTRSGDLRWVWEKGSPQFDADGKLLSVCGFITDVTQLKLSELSLKRSQERLHSIFDNSAEGIFQSSADGTYLAVNPALARIYGYETPTDMISGLTNIQQQLYVEPDRRSQFVALLERRDRVLNFESQVRRHDGTIIWISENARAVRSAHGDLLYYEGTVEDITERKTVQDDLARERNMLRTVIDAWPDVIYVKDTEGRYVLSNRAHTENLSMTEPDEIVGRRTEDFFVESRATRLSAEDSEIMQTGRAVLNREEVRLGENNEPQWFLCAKLPLHDAGGTVVGLVSMSRDITKLKQTTEQLRQSQKMEAIGRLAGGIAHDFNNIMTAILGYSEIASRHVADDPQLKHDIDQIHAGGLRAAALTQQLLTFSRKQVTLAKPLEVNGVIASMEPMLRRLIGANIHLDTRCGSGLSLVHADVHQIEQVIMNLVINARDAVDEHGLILIETSEVYLDAASAHQKLDVIPGPYVCIAICDDGSGIPKEIQERIFEPFFTTKEQGKGTGLGLATSYGIIQQSGGHICLQSTLGEGSTFRVFLPVSSLREEELPTPTAAAEMPVGRETILVTEDDQAVRELTCTLLDELGYRVLEATDGEEALDLLARGSTPRINLLLTDVVMPRLGGRGLAEKVRALSPETRILFCSGYNEEEVLRKGILADEIAFLSKPFSTEALARKVRTLLDAAEPLPRG